MPDKKLASSGEQARHDEIESDHEEDRLSQASDRPQRGRGRRAGPVGV